MANAWLHAAVDFIAYGRTYFDLHKYKDEPHKRLGWNHRRERHEWYQAFEEKWNFDNPFPILLKDLISKLNQTIGSDKAEEQMAYVDHDYIDRIWDDLSDEERRQWEIFFIWVLLNPTILKRWAGVDVVKGTIHRVIDEQEVWEGCPEIIFEYKRLRRYIEVVISNDQILQKILERYKAETVSEFTS